MYRQSLAIFGVLLGIFSPSAFAQDDLLEAAPLISSVITGPSEVQVGRTIVLDAQASRGVSKTAQYRWYLGKSVSPISRSVEAVFTPDKAGITIIRLEVTDTIDGEIVTAESTRLITVYERKIVLIADSSLTKEKLALHQQAASDAGVFLRVLQPEESAIPLDAEEELVTLIGEQSESLAGAEAVVLWTEGVKGLQALMRAFSANEAKLEAIHNQAIILITNKSLTTLARTTAGPFSIIRPDQILITRKEAINPLVSAENIAGFVDMVKQRDIDLLVIDEDSIAIRPWNVLSSLVNYMLTHGVGSQTVILLLMLPIIATILAFFKQVIGITTFGLYTPSIVALSLLALGWEVGLTLLLFILISGYATRTFMKRWRLLYIPKVAIILTVVSLTMLLLLGIGAFYGITLSGDTIFVLLIMSTLSESFLTLKTEEGWKAAIIGVGETVLAALVCVFIVQWGLLQSVILAYPELILLTIIINVGLGRWTGLRLVEYFRFRELFKHLQEE